MPQKFLSLLGGASVETRKGKTRKQTKGGGRGCSYCPLENRPKLQGLEDLTGKATMVWVDAPTKADMEAHRLLSGRTGKILKTAFKGEGLRVSDCDLQSIVRCRPVRKVESESGLFRIVERAPTEEEYHCCSTYNEQALERTQNAATTWLVIGDSTAQHLLKKEYKVTEPIFFSERFGVTVYCLPDPAQFHSKTQDAVLDTWGKQFHAFADHVRHPGRYSYVRRQDYAAVTTARGARALFRKLQAKGKPVSVDIEDADVEGKRVVLCVGFSNRIGWARTVYLAHPAAEIPAEEQEKIAALLKDFLESTRCAKILQNGAYDSYRLKQILGIRIKRFTFDTIYASFLARPDEPKHGLDALSYREVPLFAGYKNLVSKYGGRFHQIPLKRMTLYNGGDADLTFRLYKNLRGKVPANLLTTYIQVSHTLRAMEQRGPLLDRQHFEVVKAYLPDRVKHLERRLRVMAGDPGLNVRSNDELANVLYDTLGLRVPIDKYGNAVRSTRKEFLKKLAEIHEFPKTLMEFRKLDVLESRYLLKFKESADLYKEEVRTKWHLTGAATGRLRSGGSDDESALVNLQNIASDPMVKNLLVSDQQWRDVLTFQPGWEDLFVFLAYDYGQVEIRMLAEVSGDPLLLKQLQDESWDIHCHVGHELTGWEHARIKSDDTMRRAIKAVHFGIIYGLGVTGMWMKLVADGVKISKRKVEKLRNAYFDRYKAVAKYIIEKRKMAETLGYVDTIFGFVRPIDENDERGTYWGNQAINTPIQGAAHQLMLNALALLHTNSKQYYLLDRPIMEVHDALVFRVRVRDIAKAYRQGMELLTKAVPEFCARVFGRALRVPLTSECKAGFRYGSMIQIEDWKPAHFAKEWVKKNAEVEAKISKSMAA